MADTPLYRRLATTVQQQIEQGILAPGDKLLSVRRLSEQQQVSVGTVLSCYSLLEQQALIESRPQSGYYVSQPRAPQVEQPATVTISNTPVDVTMGDLALAVVRATDNPTTLPMGPAYPSNEFSICSQLWRQIAKYARTHIKTPGPQPSGYSVPPGEPELLKQLARHYGPLGHGVTPDTLVITNGCQEALLLCLQAVTEKGDIVAVESPIFYGTLQAIEALGLRVIEITASATTGISLEALELALEQWPIKAVLLSANIGNPLGFLMPDTHKQQLLQLLQRYDLPLIEDDVFADLSYSNSRPLPIKAFDRDGRVLWCSSVSKTIDASIRIGWVAPGRYYQRILYLKYVTTMASPTGMQQALASLLANNSYERHLRQTRLAYQKRRDQMIHWVQHHFPAEVRLTCPAGGFLLWLELAPEVDSLQLHQRALQYGISIAPGILFSASDKFRHCLRLNYACAADDRFEQAIKTLASLIDHSLK